MNIGRNVGGKGHSGDISNGNKDHIIRNLRKVILVIKWQRM
jgi:hypothetical protein